MEQNTPRKANHKLETRRDTMTEIFENIAKQIREWIREETRSQIAQIPRGGFEVKRLSTLDDNGIRRWKIATTADIGKAVRVSQELSRDPSKLELRSLQAIHEGYPLPFMAALTDRHGHCTLDLFKYAWVEMEAKPVHEEYPVVNPRPDGWAPAVGDWVKVTRPEKCDSWNEDGLMDYLDGSIVQIYQVGHGGLYRVENTNPKALPLFKTWTLLKHWLSPAEAPAAAVHTIEAEPAHPEPVEVVKPHPIDPNLSIWILNGKTYRLANSSDIGKQVYPSDESFSNALSCSHDCTEELERIEEDAIYPYQTDLATWRLAFIQDSSLILDELSEPIAAQEDPEFLIHGKKYRRATAADIGRECIVSDVGFERASSREPLPLKGYVEGAEYPYIRSACEWKYAWVLAEEPQLQRISEMVCEVVPDAEKWIHEGKRYRRATAEDIGRDSWASDHSFKSAMENPVVKLIAYIAGDEFPYKRASQWRFCWVLDEDQEIKVSEMVCEVVPAPDGSTTDPELPPLPEPDEEPEAPAEPEWITPGPEHVGQMVEVRQLQGGEPWKERQLLAILPETQDSRYICRSSAISSHQNWWVYARVRKAQQ